MGIKDVIKKLKEYEKCGCKGSIGIVLSDSDEAYMLDDIDYMCDAIEMGTEGVIIKAITVDEYIQKQMTE
jgi:hypothetical protein